MRYIHAVLHSALEQAVRFHLIPFSPAARVDPPKIRQEEITPLDTEQARALLDAAAKSGDRFECLYVLSLTVGLRMGEALGLKWSDIDLDAGTLRVARQLQRMREGSGLVFATGKGTPLDAQNIINRHFKPLLRRAGLPDIRWHDLRHSCSTILLGSWHAPEVRPAPRRACQHPANP